MTNREDESKMERVRYEERRRIFRLIEKDFFHASGAYIVDVLRMIDLSTPSQGERVDTPSPQADGTLADETIDRVAAAIEGAQISHSLKLTRLVDGISTYTVTVDGETHDFVDTDTECAIDQAYAHIRAIKRRFQAESVIAVLSATEGSADV